MNAIASRRSKEQLIEKETGEREKYKKNKGTKVPGEILEKGRVMMKERGVKIGQESRGEEEKRKRGRELLEQESCLKQILIKFPNLFRLSSLNL